MKRRLFLSGIGSVAAVNAAAQTRTAPAGPRSSSGMPPRKVIVGTAMQAFWGDYPGLEKRINQLTGLVDEMHAEAVRKYGRGVDLAVLPEVALTGETGPRVQDTAVPFAGAVRDAFSRQARQRNCYVVVPTYLREAHNPQEVSNAAILIGRRGEEVGIYRKMHLVVAADGKLMEGGCTPGKEAPVFACDFGKLGMQICYDMEFDRGWQQLARQGAELIAWPTQSPQTAHPVARAMENRCYIVSSTWRDNATLFEPTGKVVAQLKPPGRVLVQEIDLSYAILPWSGKLRKGKVLEEKFGAKVGYRYYEDEDCGIFWSNDPQTPVKQMASSLGLMEAEDQLAQVREHYRKVGVPGY